MLRTLACAGLLSVAAFGSVALAQSADPGVVTQQAQNQWRTSKLIGVTIVGPDQKTVGAIDEILLDHDGNAQAVVVGVGGFLGIGVKDVAVPFKALQWKTAPRQVVLDAPAMPTKPGATGPVGQTKVVKTDPAAVEASQGYPDVGMLNMTKEQLLAAPAFHYAPEPRPDEVGLSGDASPTPSNQ